MSTLIKESDSAFGEQIDALSKADYEALAQFRYVLRRFIHFSAEGSRQVGLTPQQHQILLAIKGRHDREWASISELAEAMQLRHHAAVGLVDRCEALEVVRRMPDPDDRRQVRVTLTEKGNQMLAWLSQRNLAELRTLRQAFHLTLNEALGDDGVHLSEILEDGAGRDSLHDED